MYKNKLNNKMVLISFFALIFAVISSFLFLNFRTNQLAKKEFIDICQGFSGKSVTLITNLSGTDTNDGIRGPKLALISGINSYKDSLKKIKSSSYQEQSLLFLSDADKIMKKYLSLKDKQANVEFRNPYRVEFESYSRLIAYAAARDLYDPGYANRFLAEANKVESKYKNYNLENFKEEKEMKNYEILLTRKIGELNTVCREATGTD